MNISAKLATLLSGNILGQAIPLMALPIMARLYSPSDFGAFAVIVAICALLSVASAARFDIALISAPPEHKAALARLAMATILASSCLILLVVTSIALIGAISPTDAALVVVGVLGIALFNLSNNLHNDTESYRKITLNMTLRASIWVLICLVCALQGNPLLVQAYGLQIGFVISYWLVVLLNGRQLLRAVSTPMHLPQNLSQYLEIARQYRHFALFNTPHAMLSSANLNTPSFLLGSFGHMAILGAYSQASKVLVTPWQLIGNALFKIYYKLTAARKHEQTPILPAFRRFLCYYTASLIPVFLLGHQIIETFFVLLLGEEWRIAGQIGAVLLPWIFARAIGGVLAFVPLVLDLQRPALYFEIAYASCMAMTLLVGLFQGAVMQSLMWFAWVGTLIVTIQIAWLLRKVVQYDRQVPSAVTAQ